MLFSSVSNVPISHKSDRRADGVSSATILHSRPSHQYQKALSSYIPCGSLTRFLIPLFLILLMMDAQVHAANTGSQVHRRLKSGGIASREGFVDGTQPIEKVLYPRQGGGDLLGSSTTSSTFAFSSLLPTISSSAGAASTTAQTALSSTGGTSLATIIDSGAPTTTTSPTASSILTAQISGTSSAIPKPFDTNIGNNFTTKTCPDFFNSFMNNSAFDACLPFSLLLQNSNSFFYASKYMNLITSTLYATCNVAFPRCSSLMASLAEQLRLPTNCGQEYDLQNPLVTQAYAGLLAYDPLYQAGCMKDTDGNYCFANAITNKTSPADTYPYYLPLGVGLPGGSRPTCSSCLQNIMAYFQTDAGNKNSALNKDYMSAAQQINIQCGPSFLNTSIPQVSGSVTRTTGPYTTGFAVLVAAATLFLAYLG